MLPCKPPESTPEPPSPGLSAAMLALSFTVVAVQIQSAVADGGVHSVLPILLAALLTLAGTARPKAELQVGCVPDPFASQGHARNPRKLAPPQVKRYS